MTEQNKELTINPMDSVQMEIPVVTQCSEALLETVRKTCCWVDEKGCVEKIQKAISIATQAHANQKRATGLPYITHPIEVATLVASYEMSVDSVIAAILHDVIEDSHITAADISSEFSLSIANTVTALSKLGSRYGLSREERDAESLARLVKTMQYSVDAVLIKLFDRLHNSQTFSALAREKRQRIVDQTLSIYVPLAHKIGLYQVSRELKENCYSARYPRRAKVLNAIRVAQEKSNKSKLSEMKTGIEQCLKSITKGCQLYTSHRTLLDLVIRMKNSGAGFREVLGGGILHVVVPNEVDLYQVLGLIHKTFLPIRGTLVDHIAFPKSNGYQALHTTVIPNEGPPVIICIQNKEMYRIGKFGFLHNPNSEMATQVINLLVQSVGENQLKASDFFMQLKAELQPRQIAVNNEARGLSIRLPVGASVLDYAYHWDEALADRAVSCRVNGQNVSLGTSLNQGDIVVVDSNESLQVKKEWLAWVITPKARRCIRERLEKISPSEARRRGYTEIKQALEKNILDMRDISKGDWRNLINDLKLKNIETLLMEVGKTNLSANMVVKILQSNSWWKLFRPSLLLEPNLESKGSLDDVYTPSNLIQAECCLPLPGEKTTTLLSNINDIGKISVHHVGCSKVKKILDAPNSIDKEDQIIARLPSRSNRDYRTRLKVHLYDKLGALAELTRVISEKGVNILLLETPFRDYPSRIIVEILVRDLVDLNEIISTLQKNKSVRDVRRQI